MTIYLILGFTSNSNRVAGEKLYHGHNREEAMAELTNPSEVFVRKELHELTTPVVEKHFTGSMT
jgi:hypothetical protein